MIVLLSEGIGYLIVIGVGLVMALIVTLLVKAEVKWLGTKKTIEWFSTAGRNVKTGLIASSVVSAWTWAATLLQSSTVAYQFGISGPFWYAAGASIQVVLFAALAINLKRKAPSSHTFPEIILARFGKSSQIFLSFALMTNTIVTAMLVLGGAAVVNSLTGINIYVAAFLIPIGIIIYTFFGGLKATFLAEYLNTIFLFAVILIFVSAVYFINPEIGGVLGMFHRLNDAAALEPVIGNFAGSYLTMASSGALIFGIINIIGNFGTVFVDQAYWQRAIAATPKSAFKGFMIGGGLAWFAIPFSLATTLGLAAVAMGVPLTSEQISMGLVAPSAAERVLGDVGAILLLAVLFTAVTSAGSAELVSVSSLTTYDIFRTYVKPSASGRELMKVSRLAIIGFGIGMGLLALTLLDVGVSLQFVYLAMGVLIGPAVAPITLVITWRKTNKMAATSGAIAGLVCGIVVWLSSAYILNYGTMTIATTSQSIPLLAGNLTSVSVGTFITVIGSLAKPENFDFKVMRQKILIVDTKIRRVIENNNDDGYLSNWSKLGYKLSILLTFILVIAWPMPLYLSGYVFSSAVYVVWVGIAMMWAIAAATVIIILPLVESRIGIIRVIRGFEKSYLTVPTAENVANDYYHNVGIDYSLHNNSDHCCLDSCEYCKRILVPIDGSFQSLRALNYASNMYSSNVPNSIGENRTRIFILNVIEWTDENDESIDDDLSLAMEERGRRMMQGVAVPRRTNLNYKRIVKLGDPPEKIAEMAKKLNVDMIIMGVTGLGNPNSGRDLGHVSSKVLKLTSVPVVFVP